MPPSQTAKRSSEKAAPSTAAASAAAANAAPQPHPLRSASTSRPRPRSVHGGYPDLASAAGYFAQPAYPYGRHGAAYMTGLGNFVAAERPGMPYRATDPAAAYSARRRPVSMVGTPMVSYDPAATHRLSARRPTQKPHEINVGVFGEDESDEAEYEDDDEKSTPLAEQLAAISDERRKMANEYHLMKAQLRALALKEENDKRQAQPSQPSLPTQAAASSGPKYSMRTYDKAATNITYGTHNDYDPDGIRNMPRGMNTTNLLSGGSAWERRPSIPANLDHLRYQQPAGNNPRVTINDQNWAPPRRMSYVDRENLEELRANHRQIENIFANRFAEVPQGPTIQDRRASMNFHKRIDPELYNRLAELSQDDKPILESKLRDAMEYQRQIDALRRFGHVESTPLAAKGLRHHLDLPSEAELRSKPRSNASNDGSARHRIRPVPDRGAVSNSGDEFKMLFDLTSGFEAEFEGRRLAVNPTGEGSLAEVVFGGRRGNTSYYVTSNGSVTNEPPLGRSAREKAARPVERERERDRGRDRGRDRDRDRQRERRRQRSHQHEHEDDEQSSTSTSDFPPARPTRTKRADTYTSGRRAAEEQSETERPQKGHRRTKTSDARYAAGPSTPTTGRGKRTPLG